MKVPYLTEPCPNAHKQPMGRLRRLAGAMVVLGTGLAGGCVTVKAPDAPIVIELNINIKQEVIYRLSQDAGNTIEQNEDIF
jgi:hypothetical protein